MWTAEERLRNLLEVTRAISTERDVNALLALILRKSRELTGADAGSIYVVEPGAAGTEIRKLRFKLAQNDSVPMQVSEFVMDVSTASISGYVVLKREPLAIDDAYAMDPSLGFKHSREVDEKLRYRTRSILTVPMINHRDEVIGVIQLINKKTDPAARLSSPPDCDRWVVPFGQDDRDLLVSLASQAGITLENAQLYSEIQMMFEGFVNASVQAIEQRDPTTSGHSRRVSALTVELAKTVDRVESGRYGFLKFDASDLEELRIAALLHDFGKVGVRETVLVKANKLPPLNLDLILARLDHVLRWQEAVHLRGQIDLLRRGAPQSELAARESSWKSLERKLREYKEVVRRADQPTILPEGDFEIIDEIARSTMRGDGGEEVRLLSDSEAEYLKIRKGTLTAEEMAEIRSHASHTYDFLRLIPWGKRFRRLPEIAGAHHEKLNGTGYPAGLRDAEIPVQSKMMAIADIFDALTASDRPYKKAVPVQKALDILGFEVKDGNLDRELLEMFIGAKVYRCVIPE